MSIDLLKLQPDEAERIAYAEGFTQVAQLFAQVDDLQSQCNALDAEVADLWATVQTLQDNNA